MLDDNVLQELHRIEPLSKDKGEICEQRQYFYQENAISLELFE